MKALPSAVKKYAQIVTGSLLYAIGVSLFLAPNSLASGGVSGLSIVLNSFIENIPVGIWVIIINIPIMIAGVWKLGFKILAPTFVALAVSTATMNLLEAFVPPLTQTPILACAAGGFIISAGIGIVFRGGGTTGGTDIVVKLLKLKFPYLSTGVVFLIADGAICLLGGLVFRDIDKAIYAAIALFIQMFVLNTVLYGSDEARMVYIIGDRDDIIAERLLRELNVGATYLEGKGAYTGKEKKVLMCVMKMHSLPQAREIVRECDENAFMIVNKATSVFGEGFKSHTEEDL